MSYLENYEGKETYKFLLEIQQERLEYAVLNMSLEEQQKIRNKIVTIQEILLGL